MVSSYEVLVTWRDVQSRYGETSLLLSAPICCKLTVGNNTLLGWSFSGCDERGEIFLWLMSTVDLNVIPWLKKIIWVIGDLGRTVVCDWRFDNLCGSHLFIVEREVPGFDFGILQVLFNVSFPETIKGKTKMLCAQIVSSPLVTDLVYAVVIQRSPVTCRRFVEILRNTWVTWRECLLITAVFY